MEFFNIGPGELVFLVLLAILVVGPKRAVQLMQQVGRLLARLQQEWRTIQHDIMAEVRAVQEEVSLTAPPRRAEPPAVLNSPPASALEPDEDKAG